MPFVKGNKLSKGRPKGAINRSTEMMKLSVARGTNKVLEFETKFKKFIGAKDCVAVDSGTAALHLALSMTNLKNNLNFY